MKLNRRQSCALMLVFLCVGLTVLGGLLQALNIVPDRAERTQTAEGSLPTQIAAANATRSAELTQTREAIPNTERPTIAPTETPLPTDTNEPTNTIEPSDTAIPSTDVPAVAAASSLEDVIASIEGVQVVSLATYNRNIAGFELIVARGYNTSETATRIREAVIEVIGTTSFVSFSMILSDGETATDYVWSDASNNWTTTSIAVPDSVRATAAAVNDGSSLVTTITPIPQGITYYAGANGANLRSCATANCELIVTLAAGTPILVTASLSSEEVNPGNRVWFRTSRDGRDVYVYSGVVVTAPLSTAPQLVSTPANSSGFTCNCNRLCSQMTMCEEAYFQLNQCGCSERDDDGDTIPCESLCGG